VLGHNRLASGTVVVVIVSYLAIMQSCAYAEARHVPVLDTQALVAAAPEIPDHVADEGLCQSVHQQLFTNQAFSGSLIRVAKVSDVVIQGHEIFCKIAELNVFRPPGAWFANSKSLNLQFYSVLRI
jgi:hypothetical protein